MIPQEDPYDTIRRLRGQIDDLSAELAYERAYVSFLRARETKRKLKKKVNKLAKKLPTYTIG